MALVDLWQEGYVEPVVPPSDPYHVFAQQLLTLILQEGGLGRSAWRDWIGRMPGFAEIPPETFAAAIGKRIPGAATSDNLTVTIQDGLEIEGIDDLLDSLSTLPDDEFLPEVDDEAVKSLKFADCLPRAMATRMLQQRCCDLPSLRAVVAEPIRRVVESE